jgi:hypothetical protein
LSQTRCALNNMNLFVVVTMLLIPIHAMQQMQE